MSEEENKTEKKPLFSEEVGHAFSNMSKEPQEDAKDNASEEAGNKEDHEDSAKESEDAKEQKDKSEKQELPREVFKEKSKEYNLSEMRKKLEQTEREYEEAKKRLREVESKVPTDYEQVKKDREELSKIIEAVALERSPEFKRKYDNKLESIISSIKKNLSSEDPETISKFIHYVQAPDSPERIENLNSAVESLSGITRTRIESAIMDYERVNNERQSELSNAGESLKSQQNSLIKSQQDQVTKAKEVLASVRTEAEKEIPFLRKVEGKEEWNKSIDVVHKVAEDYFLGQKDMPELAALTYKGVLYDRVVPFIESMQTEIDELNKKITELGGAAPKIKGDGKSDSKKPKLFSEEVGKSWGR